MTIPEKKLPLDFVIKENVSGYQDALDTQAEDEEENSNG